MFEILSIKLLTERKFKNAEGTESGRIYTLNVPYGAPYEEIRDVVAEFSVRLNELEEQGKAREAEMKAKETASSEEVIAEVVS